MHYCCEFMCMHITIASLYSFSSASEICKTLCNTCETGITEKLLHPVGNNASVVFHLFSKLLPVSILIYDTVCDLQATLNGLIIASSGFD